jgi:phytoene dehydrogenase-like protein
MIVIIGAGLAGLTCAKLLVEAGQEVQVFEAADQVGGRLRTDYHGDGYRLDRGFQVLFTAYPAVQRHLDITALKKRQLDPGALLVQGNKQYEITDPLRQPTHVVSSLLNPLVSTGDKLRTLALRAQVAQASTGKIFAGELQNEGKDETTEDYLRTRGFSNKIIDNFFRPFYGGIFLDRSLQTSARIFQFTFKMLAQGDIIVPAEGIQRVPEQLAAHLPNDTVHCNTRVVDILIENGHVSGVRLANGETVHADRVVIATSGPVAGKFTQKQVPSTPVSATCVYFAGDERLYSNHKILLNTDPHAYVNNAVLMTNIAPTYAPPRKHLLSLTVLGDPAEDDEMIAERARAEVATWFPNHHLNRWKLLALYRIPFAQFAQPAGIYDALPDNSTDVSGLVLAGEYTQSSSIQGAMHSGEHAAKLVLKSAVAVAQK